MNRSQQRGPNPKTTDRLAMGLCHVPTRLIRVVRSLFTLRFPTVLACNQNLVKRKYWPPFCRSSAQPAVLKVLHRNSAVPSSRSNGAIRAGMKNCNLIDIRESTVGDLMAEACIKYPRVHDYQIAIYKIGTRQIFLKSDEQRHC